ncbi:hypothetical protein AB1Y20_022675 [Prymnesium parvum]|uniref:Purple acid phosphatase n=1 Tax=Prymnesium parvum TaxID=97485 RepID=A0AB34JH00_PRYPA
MPTSAYVRPAPSEVLAHTHWAACSNAASCSEQVHLMLGGPGEVIVSFVSASASVPSEVSWWADPRHPSTAVGVADAYSLLMSVDLNLVVPQMGLPDLSLKRLVDMEDTSAWAFNPFTGARGANYFHPEGAAQLHWGLGQYNNPQMVYDSPVIHTVALRGLSPGKAYGYHVAGHRRNYSFVLPLEPRGDPPPYPFTFALTADLGQTAVSAVNVVRLREILEAAPPGRCAMLLGGDLAYADGFHPRWDTFGRMLEPLAARFPQLMIGGNHEMIAGEGWVPYNTRYPSPARSSGSPSNLWWSRDVGPAHVVGLSSYSNASPGSLQYRWLVADLAAVNRTRTPWVIVMTHVPWYSSNALHVAEAELMRQAVEPLLYHGGVDLVISGHVHAYERVLPVYQGCLNRCAPAYLTIGDGGNREGASVQWSEPQPAWSAFRESSFGSGALDIINDTHALFNWSRFACEGSTSPDHVDFNRSCESMTWGPFARRDTSAARHKLIKSRGEQRLGEVKTADEGR